MERTKIYRYGCVDLNRKLTIFFEVRSLRVSPAEREKQRTLSPHEFRPLKPGFQLLPHGNRIGERHTVFKYLVAETQ